MAESGPLVACEAISATTIPEPKTTTFNRSSWVSFFWYGLNRCFSVGSHRNSVGGSGSEQIHNADQLGSLIQPNPSLDPSHVGDGQSLVNDA